jgi:hypothetical protein
MGTECSRDITIDCVSTKMKCGDCRSRQDVTRPDSTQKSRNFTMSNSSFFSFGQKWIYFDEPTVLLILSFLNMEEVVPLQAVCRSWYDSLLPEAV